MADWISVTERLPAVDEKVLTWNGAEQSINWRFREGGDPWRWQDWGLTTHWKPLDAPPRNSTTTNGVAATAKTVDETRNEETK